MKTVGYKFLIMYIFIIFTSFFLPNSLALFAQTSAVTFIRGIDTTSVSGFIDFNHEYISIEELSRNIGLQTNIIPSTKKLDVYSEYGGIIFTSDNNFVVVSRAGSESRIYQLPLPILSANEKLYAPANYIGEYLSMIVHGKFNYDDINEQLVFTQSDTLTPAITGIRGQGKANGAVIQVSLSRLPKNSEAAIGGDNSLYLTLLPAIADTLALDSLPPSEIYTQVLAIQNPNSVQLIFKLKQNYQSDEVFVDSTTNSIMVALYSQADVKKIAAEEIKKRLEDEKKNWKLDVVVIDPGHGGKDPGAIGYRGTEEKNITLAIAKDLKKTLNQKLTKVKVVMTRDDDEFVELDKRGEIANDSGGKLFISIHCNSMPHKPNSANGLEVYFLRPGRTDEAIRIAAQENAAIKYENDYERKYQSFDEDNMILTAMAHSAYVKYSEQLAQSIADNVTAVASVADDGVSQAGFYVLVGASMPAVLVEAGYLSNKNEEKYLRSKSGQNAIARGIANAVVKFKAEYEKNFTQN